MNNKKLFHILVIFIILVIGSCERGLKLSNNDRFPVSPRIHLIPILGRLVQLNADELQRAQKEFPDASITRCFDEVFDNIYRFDLLRLDQVAPLEDAKAFTEAHRAPEEARSRYFNRLH